MVKRKILKAELRRYIRDTPFTRDEVQRLWNRFNQMDIDGRGQLNYQVTCQAIFCACQHTCLVSLETCNSSNTAIQLMTKHIDTSCVSLRRRQQELTSSDATPSAHA